MWALVDPSNNITSIVQNQDVDAQGKVTIKTRAGYRWLPLEDTKPQTTPAAPVLEGPVITVLADKVTRVWTIRARTPAEVDAWKDSLIGNIASPTNKMIFNLLNRVRALEGNPTPLTVPQFVAVYRALLPDS